MPDQKWAPIEPMSATERAMEPPGSRALHDSWRAAKARLKSSSPENLQDFMRRITRRHSVETGILERLYDLDRGVTEQLVTLGFSETLIPRGTTGVDPTRIIDMLRDHEDASSLVMSSIAGGRRS